MDLNGEEAELTERWSRSAASGDAAAAVEDGVRLLNQFPGGMKAAQVSEKILDSYYQLAGQSDPKYFMLKDKILRSMEGTEVAVLCQ